MRYQASLRFIAVLAACGFAATAGQAQKAATTTAAASLAPAHAELTPDAVTSPDAKLHGGASQYTVGVADVLHVNVWKNPDLSQTVTIGPDGFVSLPLLGDVLVAGMTTNQLGLMLTSRLESYMVSPQVTVSVVEIRSRQVYVMGQVGKPGGYPLIGPVTVLQIIAQAGGLNTFANRKGIYVLRSADGHTQKLAFNYTNVIHGKGNQNVALQPGDTVVVP